MIFPSLMTLSFSLSLLLIGVYFPLLIFDFIIFLYLIYFHSTNHGSAFFLHFEEVDLIYFFISYRKESYRYFHAVLSTQIIWFFIFTDYFNADVSRGLFT